MPYDRPTLAELDGRLAGDIDVRLPGLDARLRRSFVGVLARALAGAHHELHGFVEWVSRQITPDTADAAELERWARVWGVERLPETPARGALEVTGDDGAVIPAGSLWQTVAGGRYRATAETAIADGAAVVSVEATEAGAGGNADPGVRLSALSPLPGVVSEAVSPDGLSGGAGAEDDAALRARLLERIRRPPRGGTASDYALWGRSAHPAVTRVWVRPLEGGLGTVTVYLMTDGAGDDGIPAAAVLGAARAYIDERRPITALVTVSAPTARAFDATIRGLAPDRADVRGAIEMEIADLLRREAEPGGTILVSHLREAISVAAGEEDHVLVSPVADVQHAAGVIAVPGTVTWQA